MMTGPLAPGELAAFLLLALAPLHPLALGEVIKLSRRSRGWSCPRRGGLAPPIAFRPAALAVVTGLGIGLAAMAIPLLPPRPLQDHLPTAVLLGVALAMLALIDLRQFRLPDVLTGALTLAGILLAGEPMSALISAMLCGLAPWAIAALIARFSGRDGLGFGDAKLIAAIGAWFELPAAALIVAAASLAAIGATTALAWLHQRPLTSLRIPFGPFLCAAFWIAWITFR